MTLGKSCLKERVLKSHLLVFENDQTLPSCSKHSIHIPEREKEFRWGSSLVVLDILIVLDLLALLTLLGHFELLL